MASSRASWRWWERSLALLKQLGARAHAMMTRSHGCHQPKAPESFFARMPCKKTLRASRVVCTVAEVNRRFRAEALIHHPDKGGCDEKFRELVAHRKLLLHSLQDSA